MLVNFRKEIFVTVSGNRALVTVAELFDKNAALEWCQDVRIDSATQVGPSGAPIIVIQTMMKKLLPRLH